MSMRTTKTKKTSKTEKYHKKKEKQNERITTTNACKTNIQLQAQMQHMHRISNIYTKKENIIYAWRALIWRTNPQNRTHLTFLHWFFRFSWHNDQFHHKLYHLTFYFERTLLSNYLSNRFNFDNKLLEIQLWPRMKRLHFSPFTKQNCLSNLRPVFIPFLFQCRMNDDLIIIWISWSIDECTFKLIVLADRISFRIIFWFSFRFYHILAFFVCI